MRKDKSRKPIVHHGFSAEPLYKRWTAIVSRITDPENACYESYGGRGITICNDWRDYVKFRKWALSHGYKSYLVIDRIDVDGNYEPNNCCWVTRNESSINRRKNDNYNIQKNYRRFQVTIVRHGFHYYLGTFADIEQATEIRNEFITYYNEGMDLSKYSYLKSIHKYI